MKRLPFRARLSGQVFVFLAALPRHAKQELDFPRHALSLGSPGTVSGIGDWGRLVQAVFYRTVVDSQYKLRKPAISDALGKPAFCYAFC